MATPDKAASAQTRPVAVLKWTAIVIGSLLVVLLIALAVLDANADALRGPIARLASAHLGRTVHIDGPLQLHLLSWTPRVVVNQLRVANPDWVTVQESAGKAAGRAKPGAKDPHEAAERAAHSPGEPTDMVRIGQLQVSLSIPALFKGEVLLPYLGINDSDINLVRDTKQRANWDFSTNGPSKPAAKPAKLPVPGSLHLGAGHLVVVDEIRKLHFSGTVAADQAANGGARSLSLKGDGSINEQPFELTATGDPLITAESHKPYTLASDIRAGRTKVKSRITITKPFDMGSVVADLTASGDDLADLYYLSGLALPNTAPYTVSGHLQRRGTLLKLTNFKGTLGNSDIHGTLSIETAAARPVLNADLATKLLDIKDLGPTLGTRAATNPSSLSRQQARERNPVESTAKARAATSHAAQTASPQTASNEPDSNAGSTEALHGAKPKSAQTRTAEAQQADAKAAKGETLLPDAKLDLKRIRGMDAKVKYRAEAVQTEKMSIKEIALVLALDNGVMTFTPVAFTLPQGTLTSNIKIDGSQDIPQIAIDSRLTEVRLSQFKMKDGQEPLDGTMVGRAILHGRGKSLHEVGSTAEGTLSIVVPHGDIRNAFAELMGINAANGLGLLLTKNQDKTGIRCGVANFKAEGGVFAAQDIVIDTDKVLIMGKGEVDLGTEDLDLTLNGQPKKFRFFRIKSPIELGGTLSKPKVGLKPGNTPGQVALATALGVLATPLASVLAFVDPGLAKDADCGGLLAEAQRQGAPQETDQATDDPNKQPPKDAPIKDAQRSTKARSIT
jgi:AsmA family protein